MKGRQKPIKWIFIVSAIACLAGAFWFFQPLDYKLDDKGEGTFGAESEEGVAGNPQIEDFSDRLGERYVLLSANSSSVLLRWDWHWTQRPRTWGSDVAQISWKARSNQAQRLLIDLDYSGSYALLQYGSGEKAEIRKVPVTVLDSMGAISVEIPSEQGRTAAKGTIVLQIQGSGNSMQEAQFRCCYGKGNQEELSRGVHSFLQETDQMEWEKTLLVDAKGQMEMLSDS